VPDFVNSGIVSAKNNVGQVDGRAKADENPGVVRPHFDDVLEVNSAVCNASLMHERDTLGRLLNLCN
jgi:hypothetical protein